jgi:uncharacterized damage-inducible protein DinB
MKSLLIQYASFNNWANKKILDTISQLNDTQLRQEILSSFPGIFNTLLHLLDAESIWWQRLKLAERLEIPSLNFSGDFEELQKKILQQSGQWKEWVTNATDNQLSHVFAYQNNRREQYKQPVNEVLIHLFNHGSYHRGQLVTMLRQLGVEKIPSTDFIEWSRSKKH